MNQRLNYIHLITTMSDYGVKIGIKADTGIYALETVNCVCSGKCCRQLIPKCDRPGEE